MAGKLRVTLTKSPISHTQATRGTVRAFGLHRIGETVEVADNPATRGMARAVRFLIRTEEIDGAEATPATDQPEAREPAKGDEPAPSKPARRSTKKEEGTA